jgi:NAD(P)-dependent dehydrogenase (short-subunit alcohol dehydrogenase family)
MDISGLAAVVTGGASGLGAATARMLRAHNAKVTIFDLDAKRAQAMAAELDCAYAIVDVSNDASVNSGLDMAESSNGVARILVNCAGIAPAMKTVARTNQPHSFEMFSKTIAINLIGTFNVVAKFSARLATEPELDGERGVIVNTASISAFDGQIGQAAYAASKSGVVGMTLPIARDLAPLKIRIMSIAPGIFLTPMVESFTPEIQDALGSQIPHPSRLGKPAEYALLVESIIRNPMLNGEVIRLDGAFRMPPR